MADLVSAQYLEWNPSVSFTGGFTNATQANIPAYSNEAWFGHVWTDSAAGLVTAKANGIAVPVDPGVVISKVSILVGAAVGTISHLNVQLFSGIATPAAIGTQTTDQTSTPFTANTIYTWTLPSPVTITPAQAPNRFIYVSINGTWSGAPSVASFAQPVAIVSGGTAGFGAGAPTPTASYTGGGSTQPATLASGSTVAQAPAVWLT